MIHGRFGWFRTVIKFFKGKKIADFVESNNNFWYYRLRVMPFFPALRHPINNIRALPGYRNAFSSASETAFSNNGSGG